MKEGWEIKSLGEIADVEYGFTDKSTEEGDYRYVRITDIDINGGLVSTDKKYLKHSKEAETFLIRDKDLLMARTGATFAKVLLYEDLEPSVFASYLIRINFKEKIDNKLYWYFTKSKSYWDQANSLASGAAQPHFNGAAVKRVIFSYPKPLPEQQRILSILDQAFASIAKAKANAENNLKNAKELFDCVLDNILYDKKWKVQQLGEVCKKVEYGTSSKAQPQGELPVLRMGNIQNGRFNWERLVYSHNEEDNKKYLLNFNDVLFNRTNSPELVGKTAIYKGERPTIFAGYLIRLHRKEDLLDADYLNYYLNSKMAFEYGKSVVISSVNQANINGTKLKSYPIPLPKLEQQQTIVRQLDALRSETQKLEALYQKKIDNLEELKKTILQKAFAGELRTEKPIKYDFENSLNIADETKVV